MRYTIKTVDGNRYELPSGVQPVLINKFYTKWLTFPGKDCHLKYLNVDNVVSITEIDE